MLRIICALVLLVSSYFSWARDQQQLQHGAQLYMNYCSGCHGLRYLSYERLGTDIGLTTEQGGLDLSLLSDNLMFTEAHVQAPIIPNLVKKDAQKWLGGIPPDLSLISQQHSSQWLLNFLNKAPHNGHPIAIPNKLKINQAQIDLAEFLAYVGEPAQLIRYKIGTIVILFLFLMLVVAWQLKNLYWKNLKLYKPSRDS